MARVFLLTRDNVAGIWPQWEPLLKLALRNDETTDPEHVREAVLEGRAQLWVQWSEHLDAFVVSEIVTYPKGNWLKLWLAASRRDADFDVDAFEDVLAQWRDANECRGYEVVGRMGWLRRFPEARFVGAIIRTTIA